MLSPSSFLRPRIAGSRIIQCRLNSSQPPIPRPYKAPPERVSRHPPPLPVQIQEPVDPTGPAPRKGLLRHIWPFSKGIKSLKPETEFGDPERGREAAERAVRTGKLDPKYKHAERKILMAISALPVVIYVGWVLLQRRFGWAEQRTLPRVRRQDELR